MCLFCHKRTKYIHELTDQTKLTSQRTETQRKKNVTFNSTLCLFEINKVNFYQGERNSVRDSGEFQISRFEIDDSKLLSNNDQNQGKRKCVRDSERFEITEFERTGDYCSQISEDVVKLITKRQITLYYSFIRLYFMFYDRHSYLLQAWI